LITAAAGPGELADEFRALSRSRRLLYDSSLPCRTVAPATQPAGVRRLDVERGLLVRVLAVAEQLAAALEAQVEPRGQ